MALTSVWAVRFPSFPYASRKFSGGYISVMRRVIACLVFGATCWFTLFLSAMPRDSTQPMTTWQDTVAHLFLPETAMVGLTNAILGRLPPGPLLTAGALLGLIASLLTQVVVFSLPLWIVLMIIRAKRQRSTNI